MDGDLPIGCLAQLAGLGAAPGWTDLAGGDSRSRARCPVASGSRPPDGEVGDQPADFFIGTMRECDAVRISAGRLPVGPWSRVTLSVTP